MLLQEIQEMVPDTRLESRPSLCKRLETTRTTLDRAIAELVGEGYLYSRDGSGTYVNDLRRGHMSEVNVESWGVIVPNVMESIYSSIIRGIEQYTAQLNINVIMCNSDGDTDKQKRYIKRLTISKVSGLIIVPTICKNAFDGYQLFKQLIDAKIPFVFCNRGVDGVEVPVITSNDFYGGYIATRHLIDKGYKRIAFLSQIRYKTSSERCQGYITALMEAGIPIERKLIVLEEKRRVNQPGFYSMEQFFEAEKDVDAVFCFNDSLARGVWASVEKHGKRIPEDIGVIGYDNSPLCEMLNPKLTSVSYQSTQIGTKAAEILKKMIAGQYCSDFGLYLFQPEIVERESSLGPEGEIL